MAEQITQAKFKVLMGEFDDAIGVVSRQCRIVHEALDGIAQDFRTVSDLWQSPAANTFEPLRREFKLNSDDLNGVLAGILHRMRITYENYLETERKAERNLTVHHAAGTDHHAHKTLREGTRPAKPHGASETLREGSAAAPQPVGEALRTISVHGADPGLSMLATHLRGPVTP